MSLADTFRETSRCSGHCCRGFTMDTGPRFLPLLPDETLLELGYHRADLYDGSQLFAMVERIEDSEHDGQTFARFNCKNLLPNSDCGIYETRPGMCRRYPIDEACRFDGCTLEPANALRFVA